MARDKDTIPASPNKGYLASRYGALATYREPYLIRARRFSRLTVASLFREQGANGSTDEVIPWQSLGAFGVNSLSAKRTMAMFPPGTSFVKLDPSRSTLQSLRENFEPTQRGELKAEIDKGLSMVERELMECMEEDGDRWRLFDTNRHLMVGGSHCLKVDQDAILQSISLNRHVVVRDKKGNVLEGIIEDALAWDSLSADMQDLCRANGYKEDRDKAIQPDVMVYTQVKLRNGKYHLCQEVMGQRVPGSEATYNKDACPYLFLREVAIEDEHYGRAFVEDLESDLQTLDSGWQTLMEGGAAIAQMKWLVKPGGVTNKEQFAKAVNGQVITGDIGDVAVARSEKTGDLGFMVQLMEKVESRLEQAFLLYSSVQRSGERVTREEIITVRQDLDETLGGIYANQETTFQQPYAKLKLIAVQRQGRVTKLPQGTVKMRVLTGAAGLGRQKDALDTDEFLLSATSVFGPDVLMRYINVSTYLDRQAANRGVDTEGLIYPREEVEAQQQASQMDALTQQVAPEVVKQGGEMLQNYQNAAIAQEQGTEAAPTEGV